MIQRYAFLLCLVVVLSPITALGQTVKGPYKVSPDSIGITLTQVKLKVADTKLDFSSGSPTPYLRPTGGKEAQVWFAMGFMLESCRLTKIERMSPPHEKNTAGSTVNRISFQCHYKASEFRSAVGDLIN